MKLFVLCTNCKNNYQGIIPSKYSKHKIYSPLYSSMTHATINACPNCRKDWRRSRTSGVNWRLCPELDYLMKRYVNK